MERKTTMEEKRVTQSNRFKFSSYSRSASSGRQLLLALTLFDLVHHTSLPSPPYGRHIMRQAAKHGRARRIISTWKPLVQRTSEN